MTAEEALIRLVTFTMQRNASIRFKEDAETALAEAGEGISSARRHVILKTIREEALNVRTYNNIVDTLLKPENTDLPQKGTLEFITLHNAITDAIAGYAFVYKKAPPNIVRTILNSTVKAEKEAYYAKIAVTKQDLKDKSSPQVKQAKYGEDLKGVIAEQDALLKKYDGSLFNFSQEDAKRYQILAEKRAVLEKKKKKETDRLQSTGQDSLTEKVIETNSKNPAKVNKAVKDAKEKNTVIKEVKKSDKKEIKKQVIEKEAVKPVINLTAVPALATTRNSTNIFTGKDPISKLVATPTQLLDKDFTDFRVYEATSPFFSGEEYPAYMKVVPDNPTEVDFSDTITEDLNASNTSLTSGPPDIDNPFQKGSNMFRYNQFTVVSLMENGGEKYQIVDSNGFGFSIFGFGKKVEIWSISGELINDRYNNWLSKFREVWERHIRLEKLIENKQYIRMVIPSQRIAINCYPVNYTIQHAEQRESVTPFSMSFIVRDTSNFYSFPFGKNSAAEALIKNLMFLDGVVI